MEQKFNRLKVLVHSPSQMFPVKLTPNDKERYQTQDDEANQRDTNMKSSSPKCPDLFISTYDDLKKFVSTVHSPILVIVNS